MVARAQKPGVRGTACSSGARPRAMIGTPLCRTSCTEAAARCSQVVAKGGDGIPKQLEPHSFSVARAEGATCMSLPYCHVIRTQQTKAAASQIQRIRVRCVP